MTTLACLVAFDKRSAEQAAGPMTDLHNEDIASIVGGSEYFLYTCTLQEGCKSTKSKRASIIAFPLLMRPQKDQ